MWELCVTRRIATILARSGSKALVNKNIRSFRGQPMLARTVEQALRCGLFDTVVVSSDSELLLDVARAAGAHQQVYRPEALANDSVTKLPGIRHAVVACETTLGRRYDVVADLAVTSPLRSDQDIAGAISLLEAGGAPLVLSACEAKDNPYFNMLERSAEEAWVLSKELSSAVSARQQAPRVYSLNGAVYVWRRNEIARPDDRVVRRGIQLYLMPLERSIDVDDEFDLYLAEAAATFRPSLSTI
jgi:CMP-N,N'-diacetyllegionaminic acid synthase